MVNILQPDLYWPHEIIPLSLSPFFFLSLSLSLPLSLSLSLSSLQPHTQLTMPCMYMYPSFITIHVCTRKTCPFQQFSHMHRPIPSHMTPVFYITHTLAIIKHPYLCTTVHVPNMHVHVHIHACTCAHTCTCTCTCTYNIIIGF